MKVLKNSAEKPLDVHLMIVEPEKYLKKFAEMGANILTVHIEVCKHLRSIVQKIRSVSGQTFFAIY